MTPLRPWAAEEDQCKRAAARLDLHFHIDTSGTLTTHAGHNSEKRDATDAELQMWQLLVGQIDGVLNAVPEEFECCLRAPGVYYLNAKDLAVLRPMHSFSAEMDPLQLRAGRVGSFEGRSIFLSRAVSQGYYLALASPVPELNWRPGETRTLAPELDERLRCELETTLSPLITSY